MHNQQRILDKSEIKKYLPNYNTLFTKNIADFDDETHGLTTAIDRELNFLEFIAAGIDEGDLDDKLSKKCLRSIAINFRVQTEDYIAHWQDKNPSTWEYFVRLSDRWK